MSSIMWFSRHSSSACSARSPSTATFSSTWRSTRRTSCDRLMAASVGTSSPGSTPCQPRAAPPGSGCPSTRSRCSGSTVQTTHSAGGCCYRALCGLCPRPSSQLDPRAAPASRATRSMRWAERSVRCSQCCRRASFSWRGRRHPSRIPSGAAMTARWAWAGLCWARSEPTWSSSRASARARSRPPTRSGISSTTSTLTLCRSSGRGTPWPRSP
mmetsp:Transcript_37687/g.108626  ORF Transcript_37687/g.108626 Transcript_37687/m.108626 type:complete len:213 (+) Transcript_37687:278-916(+)